MSEGQSNSQSGGLAALLGIGKAEAGTNDWNGVRVYAADPKTGKVLLDDGADAPHDAASLTKLMTFYLALEAERDGKLNPDKSLVISDHAAHAEYTRVIKDEKLKLPEAYGALMTASDNGVAVALSEAIDKTDKKFISRMNQRAAELGLEHTKFYNTNGLPQHKGPDNVSTARDMATLINKLNADFPEQAESYMGQSSVKYGRHHETYPAHYSLVKPESGIELPEGYHVIAKTGYTDKANYNIASIITAPNGEELTVVVMGMAHSPGSKLAQEAGVPETVLASKKKTLRGDFVRDALVLNISRKLLGEGGQDLTVAIPVPQMPEVVVTAAAPSHAMEHPPTADIATPAPHHPAHKKPHHPKHPAQADNAPFSLSDDHKAILAAAQDQFKEALKTGGTVSLSVVKKATGKEVG